MENRIHLVHRDTLSCEPILRRMPNQELLCISQCGDVMEPAPGNRVYAFHSKDNGHTWSKAASIYPETGQAVYITEVMLLDLKVYAFLTIHSGRFLNMQCVVMMSQDNGYTWENAGAPPFFPTFCFIRGMIELNNGSILIPYQHFPVSEDENIRLVTANHNIQSPIHQKAIWDARIDHLDTGVLISEDRGLTYKRYHGPQTAIKGATGRRWAWTEPTVAELSDGRLVMLLRICGTGWLWRSESTDGGRSWSEAIQTDIPNPSNKPKLIVMPDKRIALIHTPNNQCGFEHRNPLSIWISDDDMKSWGYKQIVTDFPGSYCYPDGIYECGKILFTIEYNRHDILFIEHLVRS